MAHCATKCRSKEAGDALAIKEVKRFLTDWELSSGEFPKVTQFPRKYEEKVAIIGSGPAGLAAGYYLAQEGYAATIFEKFPVAGGMLAVAIPEYRLPKKLLQLEIDAIRQAGVTIKTNAPIENIDVLFEEGYKAVLIAVGAHKNRKLGIPGEDADGVVDPITFLRKVNLGEEGQALGSRVGIIGGGNTAIDTARTALRLGSEHATVFYRRTRAEMPAIAEEIEAALEEGVKIEFLVTPTKINSESGKLKSVEFIRTKLGEPDASGRKRPVPIEGSKFVVELDALLPAVSQDAEVPSGFGVELSKGGAVATDKHTLMTSRRGVFACGDAVTLPTDVTSAMAEARKVAEFIHKYLRGEELTREFHPVRPSVVVEPIEMGEEPTETSRPEMSRLPAAQRKHTFEEVDLGYTKEAAMKEGKRCLRCDWELQKLKQQRAHDMEEAAEEPLAVERA